MTVYPIVTVLSSLLAMTSWRTVNGHGYLSEPPSRSSMWRYGFGTPRNYDDNALNCGGLNTQWYVNNGKCGVCGDPWQQPTPRDNEAGGRYGRGIISRNYTSGQAIDVRVTVTANHRGWFEFRLCVHNSPTTPITQACLDQHRLQLADGSGTQYHLSAATSFVQTKVKLPPGVTCTQCVLQWKWHSGNNWGSVQEEFYGCSDIAISPRGGRPAATTRTPAFTTIPTVAPYTARPTTHRTTPVITIRPTTRFPSQVSAGCYAIGDWQGVPNLDMYCREQCPRGNCPANHCACPGSVTTRSPPVTTPQTTSATSANTAGPQTSSSLVCHATGQWQGSAALDTWCQHECPRGTCPADTCKCDTLSSATTFPRPTTAASTQRQTTASRPLTQTSKPGTLSCHGVGAWHGVPALDLYCHEQCPMGNCPPQCSCSPQNAKMSTAPSTIPFNARTSAPPTINHRATTPDGVVTTPSLTVGCVAIGSWQGDTLRDRWCNDNCPLGVCPSQNCRCGPETSQTPAVTSNPCRAIGLWAAQPLLDQWCRQTCSQSSGCDPKYCSCNPVSPTAQQGAATTISTVTPSIVCRAINGWAGSPELDQYCNSECHSGGPCPPQYCSCLPVKASSSPRASPGRPVAANLFPGIPSQQSSCHGINGWQGVAELDEWCRSHCTLGECPPAFCSCQP